MLKYKPKQFWGLLKHGRGGAGASAAAEIDAGAFA